MINRILLTCMLAGLSFLNIPKAVSGTFILAIENIDSTLATPLPALSTGNVTSEQWQLEYDHKMVMVDVGGVLAPIEIEKPTVTLINKNYGRFMFSEGQVRSVTRVPLVTYQHEATDSYSLRPTLFISICGFTPTSSGATGCKEQNSTNENQIALEKELAKQIDNYQYKHFIVHWESSKSMKGQVNDLANHVNSFLNDRLHNWDVVIFGYSRGGVFAHELSGKIVKNTKINKLHTFLLDPTAAKHPLNDVYPAYKHKTSPDNHYASLYFDDKGWLTNILIQGLDLSILTSGDKPIDGYTNYGLKNHTFKSSSHEAFFSEWLANQQVGLDQALIDVLQRKVPDNFAIDGTSGSEIVTVSAPGGIDVNVDVDVTTDHVSIWAEVTVDGVPVTSTSFNADSDGFEYSGGTAIAVSHMVVRKDQIAVASSSPLTSYSASIDVTGVNANVSVVGFDVNTSVSPDGAFISVDFGPFSAEAGLSLSGSLSINDNTN